MTWMKYVAMGALAILLGCPKSVTVICTWTGDGNPKIPACGVAPCLLYYTLTRQDTGAVIATIPLSSTSYSFSASTVGISQTVSSMPKLGLQVNEQTAAGVVSSPVALTSVVVQ